jgi:predicted RNA-binding protein YlxR (DUF448 family)
MKPRKLPVRKCIACQEMIAKKQLIRLVRTPDGHVELDVTGKKSGRGAYVHADELCIRMVRKSKAFDRALKQTVSVEIYELLEKEAARLASVALEGANNQS